MIPRQNGWSDRDLNMFMIGFISCQAQQLKDEGLFPDLTLQETIDLLILEYTKDIIKEENLC